MKPSDSDFLVLWWLSVGVEAGIVVVRAWMLLRKSQMRFTMSDCFLMLSCLTVLPCCGVATYLLKLMNDAIEGVHTKYPGTTLPVELLMSVAEAKKIVHIAFTTYTIFMFVVFLCKMTLAAIYLQLYRSYSRSMKILTIAGTSFLVLSFLAAIFLEFLYCGPHVSSNWDIDPLRLQALCIAPLSRPVFIMFTVYAVSTDLVLIVIGLLTVWGIRSARRSWRHWVAVGFILSISLVSLGASIVRCVMLIPQISDSSRLVALETVKITLFWGSLESLGVVVACCLPTVRMLLRVRGEERRRRWGSESREKGGSQKSRSRTVESEAVGESREELGLRVEDMQLREWESEETHEGKT